mmetsp:Transcript_1566/g.1525  ORF Transcript_1566/g.1525 Transcript_1566/m.1525 type:complete len:89 (+) Transcript_1566:169-435(+)
MARYEFEKKFQSKSERPTSSTELNFAGKLVPELKLDSVNKFVNENSHSRGVSTLFEPDAEKSEYDITPNKKLRTASFGGADRRQELYL